ncbi:MAG: mechanosensitive ion channel family protein [Flavobacteriaceae bacterium]
MVSEFPKFLQTHINLGQIESEIAASLVIFSLALIIGWIVYSIFKKYLVHWAKETETKIDDQIIQNIKAPIILLSLLLGLHYGLQPLSLLDPYVETLSHIFSVAQILVATFIIVRVLNVLINWFGERAKQEKRMSEHLLSILKQVIRAIIYLFALFAILAVFNVDLSGIVVGLGVGGIAIALALQNILGDAFSAFLIYFDRPFEVGDFITVDNYSGTVNKIGLRSTRLHLLQGEELVLSNRELTTTSIQNFKKLKKRRIVFRFGVAANTPLDKLKKIPTILEKIIKNTELAEFNRVHFAEFGDFTFNFEVVFYVKTSDYAKYMDTRQEINFGIIDAFEKEEIVMPYPTQTIYIEKNKNKSD